MIGLILPASAQKIIVFEPDRHLEIAGSAGGRTDPRSLNLRTDGNTCKVRILSSDLQEEGRGARIDRLQVQILSGSTAVDGPREISTQPSNFGVSVATPPDIGTFKGAIYIYPEAPCRTDTISVPLTLTVRPVRTTALTAKPASVTLPMVNSSWPLAEFLSGANSEISDYRVHFAGVEPSLPVSSITLDNLRGAATLAPFPTKRLQADRAGDYVSMTVKAGGVLPDRYAGTMTVRFKGLDQPVDVPVEMTVQTYPVWVLLVIFLGVVLGRASKWANDRGLRLVAAYHKLDLMNARIEGFTDDDRTLFKNPLSDLQRQIDARNFDAFDKAWDELGARADILEYLNQFIALATTDEQRGCLSAFKPRIETTPADALPQLRKEIEDAANAPAGAAAAQRFMATVVAAATTAASAAPGSWRVLQQAARRISRQRITDKLYVHFGVHAVGVLLVVVLAFIGFDSIYLKPGVVFGAHPGDWLTALIWGFSADVAGRTLANLPARPGG